MPVANQPRPRPDRRATTDLDDGDPVADGGSAARMTSRTDDPRPVPTLSAIDSPSCARWSRALACASGRVQHVHLVAHRCTVRGRTIRAIHVQRGLSPRAGWMG